MKIDETLSFADDTLKDIIKCKISCLVNHISNLEYIILFGSHARMEQKIKSDIDLMAVTSTITDRLLRGDLCSRFEEENIDLVFYDVDTFRESECLLISQVKKEGIVVWKRT